MKFGIKEKTMDMILDILKLHPEVMGASIFGSRSMGNYKNGSDIDMVIYGAFITNDILNKINIELNEELPIPYYFDIVHYESLSHDKLKSHIDEFGVSFYKK